MEIVNSMGTSEFIIQPIHCIQSETPADFISSPIPLCFSATRFLVIVGIIKSTEKLNKTVKMKAPISLEPLSVLLPILG